MITSIISTDSGSIWSARSIFRPPDWTQVQRLVISRRSLESRDSITAKITTVSTKPTAGRPTPTARVTRRSGSVGHSDSTMVPSSGSPSTTHPRTEISRGSP